MIRMASEIMVLDPRNVENVVWTDWPRFGTRRCQVTNTTQIPRSDGFVLLAGYSLVEVEFLYGYCLHGLKWDPWYMWHRLFRSKSFSYALPCATVCSYEASRWCFYQQENETFHCSRIASQFFDENFTDVLLYYSAK